MKAIHEIVEAVVRALELDEAAIARRKAFLEFTDEDVARLKALHRALQDLGPEFAQAFYDHLLRFEETRRLLSDPTMLERLKQTQAQYFDSLTAGDYGREYIRHRLRVGVVHQRVGLAPAWYLGAYSKYFSGLLPELWRRLGKDPETFVATVQSLSKIILLDIGLAIDTYIEADRRTILVLKEYAEMVFASIPFGLVVLSPELTVLSANQWFLKRFGLAENAVRGRPLDAVVAAEGLKAHAREILEHGIARHDMRLDMGAAGKAARIPVRVTLTGIRLAEEEEEEEEAARLLMIVEDMTEHAQQELALEAEREMNRRLLEAMPAAVVACNGDGQLSLFNEVAKVWYGVDAMTLPPEQWAEHYDLYEADGITPLATERIPLLRAFRGENVHDAEIAIVPKGQPPRFVMCNGSPLHASDGRPLGAVVVMLDITERKRAEAALWRLNDELQRLNAGLEARVAERTARLEKLLVERQDFLATMSHEIRTPLTGLLGMLELLSLSNLSDEQRHELAIARESGRALSRIIDDILDYSKSEAGKLNLSPEPESLHALIEQVRNAHLTTASAKGISLMSFVDPRLPQAVLADGLRVRQILQNFVSNALKFTAEGYVELRAEWLDGNEESVTLKLAVRDTGIGIAPEVQAKIFERYAQADATTARRYGGTGLGLAICKHLVELMNGAIGVESALARGSTFYVILTLPVAHGEAPAPVAAGTLRQLDSGGKPVLVADDHPTNRALIARQMALLGLPVELAENGNQALAKWKHGDYALILTDVHMPVMDGFELAQAVREIEAKAGRKHTPILAWTAAAMGEEAARAHAAGMDDVLVKPTELAELRRVLARWLPFAAANNGRPVPAHPDTVLDRAVLSQLAEGAEEERLILADFVHQTRRDLAELSRALDRGDAAAAARQAHRVKGASRMTGAMRLAQRGARAEDAARRHDLKETTARLSEMESDLADIEASSGVHDKLPEPASKPDAPPVWDAAVLTDMVGEAPALQREMIESFFTHAAETLREVRAAYEKREARPLARAAHQLKSAARAIGALELAQLAAELEAAGNNEDWPAAQTAHARLDAAWARLAQRLAGGPT